MESQKKSNIYFRVYYRLYLDIYNYFLHFVRMVDMYMVLGIDGMGWGVIAGLNGMYSGN